MTLLRRYPGLGRDAAFYYALANLFLLPFWYLAFSVNGMPIDPKFVDHYYELVQIFDYVDYFAGVLLGIVLALAFLIVAYGIEARSARLRRIYDGLLSALALVVLIAILWQLRFPPSGDARISDAWIFETLTVVAVGLAILVAVGFLFRKAAVRALCAVVLCTLPIGIVMAINAGVAFYKTAPEGASLFAVDRSLAPLVSHKGDPKGRVVVIVFDLWDQRLTFEARDSDVELPEIDRFLETSFYATNAHQAAARTQLAFPSMLTGRKAVFTWPITGDDLNIVFAERYSPQRWSEHPGVFAAARARGYNIAVATSGYHPFCRLFRRYISHCWIDDTPFTWTHKSVLNRMDDVVREVFGPPNG